MAYIPSEKASRAKQQLIYRLSNSAMKGASALAGFLGACSEDAPCQSAACPTCGAAFQQATISVVEQFLRIPARAIRRRMTAVTIVPASGCLAPEALTPAAFSEVGSGIAEALRTTGLPPTIFGLEVSFNEDTTGRVDPHWCVHGHGLQLGWISDARDKALRELFPKTEKASRPVHCDVLDQRLEGQSYPFKPERFRRVTFLNDKHPHRRPFLDTKSRPLRSQQSVTLAMVDHQVGFHRRLLLHEIDGEAVRQHLEGLRWPRDGP